MSSPLKPTSLIKESLINAKTNGTVPQELKDLLAHMFGNVPNQVGFAQSVVQRVLTTEMYLYRKEEEPGKWEAKTVSETVVTPDMSNLGGMLHGGCISFMIDSCTSVALSLLLSHLGKSPVILSQSLNVMFHAPAPVGTNLKIISQTIASGSRITSARCEIYDTSNSRLVATGVHTKMGSQQSPGAYL